MADAAGAPRGADSRRLFAALALLTVSVLALVFGAYEIVERTLLQGASPRLLHALHIARGIGSSLIVGGTVAWYLLTVAPKAFSDLDRDLSGPPAQQGLELRDVARWAITMRWIVAAGAVAGMVIVQHGLRLLDPSATLPLSATVTLLVVVNIAFSAWLRRGAHPRRHLSVQISVDVVALTLLLAFSGGMQNPLRHLYVFHVVLAAIVLPPRVTLGHVGLATLCMIALAVLDTLGLTFQLSTVHTHELLTRHADLVALRDIGEVGAGMLLFFAVAYFAIQVSAQLRKQTEQARAAAREIEASTHRLEAVVDSMGVALLLWDRNRQVVWSNQIARLWFGPRRAETDRSCGLDRSRICGAGSGAECPTLSAYETGQPREIEGTATFAEGDHRIVTVQGIPLLDDRGQVEMVLELVRDVTRRRALEAETLHATKMAVLGRIAAGMAHEIGNPLASMAVRLQLLESKAESDYTVQSARLLGEQVGRIERLVRSIARFGHPRSSKGAKADLAENLREVARVLRLDPKGRMVEIRTDVPDGLPLAAAQPDKLTQVFLNLGLNALQAIDGEGRLEFRVHQEGRHLVVDVVDDGPGLQADARENLFRPFHTTKADGSGLGLFLSHQTLCELGGAILAREAERGAHFEVRLPLA